MNGATGGAGLSWAEVEVVLDAALEQAPGNRRAWLKARYGDRPDTLTEVMSLLSAIERSEAFLEPDAEIDLLPSGVRFGVWKVVETLGHGGMGEVYRVERDDGEYQQSAALKLMRPLPDAYRARFLAERQIVAELDHPGIARILDGGLGADGRPFMVQEFIEGLPIDQWCAQRGLPPVERVRLIIDVWEAVSHAHAKLIVHRDIKPSNILVSGDGRSRLIDFGVAQQIGGEKQATQSPVSVEYAAPELLDGGAASIMTDVYGLAATLFELLGGQPPVDVAGLAPPVAVRRVADEPATRLRTVLQQRLARPAAADLEAVLDKALSKRPEDRYVTVESFAADLRRALALEPVQARASDRGYRARRFLRRRRLPIAAAAAVVFSLSGGLAVAVHEAQRAERQRDAALMEQARLQAVQNYLYFMLRTGAETSGPDVDAAGILDAAADQVVQQFQADPARGGPVMRMLGELYFYMNDYEAAKPLLDRLMTARGVEPAIVAAAAYDLAQIRQRQGDPAEARRLLARAQAFWQGDPARWRSELIDSRLTEARLLRDGGDVAAAVSLLQANLPARIAMSGPDHRDTGVYHNDLGVMLVAAGRAEEAAPSFQAALKVWSANGLDRGPDALNTLNNLAALEVLSGRPERAEPLFRQALEVRRSLYGPSAATAALISNHGKTLLQLKRHAEALPLLREAALMAENHAGVGSLHYASAASGLSEVLLAGGEAREAERVSVEALSQVQAALGEAHPATAIVRVAVARVRGVQGRKAEARALLDQAQDALSALGPAGAAQVAAIERIRGQYGLE